MNRRSDLDSSDRARPHTIRFLRALDDSDVAWALARPVGSLADPDGDTDVVVAGPDLSAATDLARRSGFGEIRSGWPGDVVLVARRGRRLEWLHLQPALRIGAEAVAADVLLHGAQRVHGVPTLGDDDMLAALLLHDVVDRDGVPVRHRDVVGALSRGSQSVPRWVAHVASRHAVDYGLLVESAAVGDWSRIATVAARTRSYPTRRARVVGRIERIRRTWVRRGLSIAVIGPDGAGKSSLVEHLIGSFPTPTTSMYMGLTGGRMPAVERWRVPGLVLGGQVALLWVRWCCAMVARLRGRNVVFDRYVLDGRVPSGRPLSTAARFRRSLLARSCPPPEIAVLLDAPGSLLHERSGEYDADTLERWRRRYRELAEERSWIAVVDASQPSERVADEVVTLAWATLSSRWRRGAARPRPA